MTRMCTRMKQVRSIIDCICVVWLQEKEKLYVELKGILARQPGPEVAEQLSIYQVGIKALQQHQLQHCSALMHEQDHMGMAHTYQAAAYLPCVQSCWTVSSLYTVSALSINMSRVTMQSQYTVITDDHESLSQGPYCKCFLKYVFVTALQASLRDKTKQLKAMASELNMYQAQVAEYKYEIERLTRELATLKKKYFETKKREQLEKEAQRGTAVAAGMLGSTKDQALAASPQQRFTGGGFSLSTVIG